MKGFTVRSLSKESKCTIFANNAQKSSPIYSISVAKRLLRTHNSCKILESLISSTVQAMFARTSFLSNSNTRLSILRILKRKYYIFILLHFHITFSYYYIFILLYFHIIIFSYYYIFILLYFHIIIFSYYYISYYYIFILLYFHIITFLYYYIFILLHFYIIIFSYYYIFILLHFYIIKFLYLSCSKNIECVFYKSIFFIDQAENDCGKVYVHCY